jgi:glycerol-3-phosphate acyltransferase PlsX
VNKIITLDAMGGDLGPLEPVKAAIKFIKENLDYKIFLVGDASIIQPLLTIAKIKNNQIEVDDVKLVASSKFSRNEKNSMNVALDYAKKDKTQAVISSGLTSALVAGSFLKIKRIKNIHRPAFMMVVPTI